eukprot:SAG11_NODE_2093_length_3834_cov_2.402945_2_plen_49_part_00
MLVHVWAPLFAHYHRVWSQAISSVHTLLVSIFYDLSVMFTLVLFCQPQ